MGATDTNKPNVAIVGAGYVGLTTAVLLASSGYNTHLVDVDKEKVSKIKKGESPFFEPNLDGLIKKVTSNKKLVPTSSYEEAVPQAEIVLSCVGTPDKADGSSNLKYVFAAAREIAQHAKDGTVIAQKSTVPVGTGRELAKEIKAANGQLGFHYVSNPEFLREGAAISDTLYPDRIVVGGDDKSSLEKVAQLYEHIIQSASEIDPVLQKEYQPHEYIDGKIVYTTLESAELIKVTSNAFLALKISFANSIAKLADEVDGDIVGVMDGVGLDRRIGRAFLNAGRGYGGGCFPKDVSGLIAAAEKNNVSLEIIQAATHVNSSMPGYIIDKVTKHTDSFKNKDIAVLGLSFKPATSDTRRSPAVQIANLLVDEGASVRAYDPKAIFEDGDLSKGVAREETIDQTIKNADAVFIATDWPEFAAYQPEQYAQQMKGNLLVDCMNMLNKDEVARAGLTYIGVGR